MALTRSDAQVPCNLQEARTEQQARDEQASQLPDSAQVVWGQAQRKLFSVRADDSSIITPNNIARPTRQRNLSVKAQGKARNASLLKDAFSGDLTIVETTVVSALRVEGIVVDNDDDNDDDNWVLNTIPQDDPEPFTNFDVLMLDEPTTASAGKPFGLREHG